MSAYLPVVALLCGALVIVLVAAVLKRREQSELCRLLQKQAKKRGGEVKPATLLYYPRLTFVREDVEFTTSALVGGRKPDRRPATTYVTFPLLVPPGNEFRITKRTKSLQALVDGKLEGSQQIQTGNPTFDEAFMVESENSVTTLHFLSDEVQRSLLAFDDTVDVRFDGSRFIVTVDEIASRESTLDRMIGLAVCAHGVLRYLATGSSRRASP